MLAKYFLGLSSKGPYLSFEKERDNFCVVFTYYIKQGHETRKVHVAVVQRRLKNVTKKKTVMYLQSCCFANLILLFFPDLVGFAVVVA